MSDGVDVNGGVRIAWCSQARWKYTDEVCTQFCGDLCREAQSRT